MLTLCVIMCVRVCVQFVFLSFLFVSLFVSLSLCSPVMDFAGWVTPICGSAATANSIAHQLVAELVGEETHKHKRVKRGGATQKQDTKQGERTTPTATSASSSSSDAAAAAASANAPMSLHGLVAAAVASVPMPAANKPTAPLPTTKKSTPAAAPIALQQSESDDGGIEDSESDSDGEVGGDGIGNGTDVDSTARIIVDDETRLSGPSASSRPSFRFNLDFPFLQSTAKSSAKTAQTHTPPIETAISAQGNKIISAPPNAAYTAAQRKRKREDEAAAAAASAASSDNTPSSLVLPGESRLSSLPTDWMYQICGFLGMSDVGLLGRTSRHFRGLLNSDRIWRGVCQANAVHPCGHRNHPWRELVLTRMEKLRDRFKPAGERKYKKKYRYVCTCCKCVKGFELLSEYDRHLEVRHGPNRTLPPVPKARKSLNPTTGVEVKKTPTGKDFHCPILACGKSFRKSIELKYHFDGVHKQERAFPCHFPGCFKSFVSPAQLSLHECKHTGAARPHQCPRTDCNKSFNTPSQLQNHIQTHLPSTARTMIKCPFPQCAREYHSNSAVLKHYATEHDESQLHYRCSDYNLLSIFVGSPHLDHISSTCTAAFYFKATWKEHLHTKHHITATHQQLQQVVKYMKTNKLIAKAGMMGIVPNGPMPHLTAAQPHMVQPPSAAAAAGTVPVPVPPASTPQELAATAVSNAIRAASVSSAGPPTHTHAHTMHLATMQPISHNGVTYYQPQAQLQPTQYNLPPHPTPHQHVHMPVATMPPTYAR